MPQAKSWANLVAIILLGAPTVTSAFEPKDNRWVSLGVELTTYRQQLDAVRREHGGVRKLPPISFFLFGMGERRKLVYQQGVLRDARTGKEVRRWEVSAERIVPPAYTVALKTRDGSLVTLVEDEEAVWLEEGGKRTALTRGHVSLPSFAGHRHAAVLRVLHQELLVNVIDGKPVPNFMVYAKPWYRDGAMMAMAFQKTGNLGLIKDWVTGLREPFDKNNGDEEEADNPGEVLYLISLVAGKDHPLVPTTLQALKRFEKDSHIEGRSDFASHPVYQTKWAKFGLKSLGLDDPYATPQVVDSYATLCWWAHQGDDQLGQEVIESDDYPYLTWAGSHHTGKHEGKLGDWDYPLTWEAKASQANHRGMDFISPKYAEAKLCTPHTWHATEAFLYLLGQKE
jgi:hypothetical protein